jgi:predicted transposase/invertase (TIGR01784 family)
LELPKFKKSEEELSSDLETWLYFLRHMEKIDTDGLPAAFQQRPLVLHAVEELKMLAQNDVERERYEARRKAQLDYNTGLKAARLEGREEGRQEGCEEGRSQGRAEGEIIGRIHLCERLLKRQLTPTEQLANRPLEELMQLADDLQSQILKE